MTQTRIRSTPLSGVQHSARRWAWRLATALTVAILLCGAGLRWLGPELARLKPDIEQAISSHLGVPVQVSTLTLRWWGWRPTLRLTGVQLGGNASDKPSPTELTHTTNTPAKTAKALPIPALAFERAELQIDPFAALSRAQIKIIALRLFGADITLRLPTNDPQPSSNDDATASLMALLQPLYAADLLDIDIARLRIVRDQRVWYQGAARILLSTGERRLLSARFTRGANIEPGAPNDLGSEFDEGFSLRAELSGNSKQPLLDFFLHGQQLPAPLVTALPALDARAELRLWGQWRPHQALQLNGRFSGLVAEPWQQRLSMKTWDIDIEGGQQDQQHWQWRGRWRSRDTSGIRTAAPFRIELKPSQEQHNDSTALQLGLVVNQLSVAELLALLEPLAAPAARSLLTQLTPRGQVDELVMTLPLEPLPTTGERLQQLSLAARLTELSVQHDARRLRLSGLSGELRLDNGHGQLRLDSSAVRIAGADLRQALSIDTLNGTIRWRRQHGHWRLSIDALQIANTDLSAQLDGHIDGHLLPDGGIDPLLDLRLSLAELDLAQVSRYLPAAAPLAPKLRAWLDQALLAGRARRGAMVVIGRARDFPFDQPHSGHFEARLQLVDATLHYHPNWPTLQHLNAELAFIGRRLSIAASRATLGELQMAPTIATIERIGRNAANSPDASNQSRSVLQVDGTLNGTWQQLLSALQTTPLVALQRHLQPLSTGDGGAAELALALTIPLHSPASKDANINIDGRLSLRDSEIGVATGDATIDASLQLPIRAKKHYRLALSSDLRGTHLRLPGGLGKTAATARPLRVAIRGDDSGATLNLAFAPNTTAAFRYQRTSDELHFQRGELRINDGPATLPQQPGLALYLQRQQLMLGDADAPTDSNANLAAISWPPPDWLALRLARAKLAQLRIGGQTLADVKLTLRRGTLDDAKGDYQLQLSGPDLSGSALLPRRANAERPLRVTLQKLRLRPSSAPPTSSTPATLPGEHNGSLLLSRLDPRRLPPFSLHIEQLHWHDDPLGTLSVNAERRTGGLALRDFNLRRPDYHLSADASWLVDANGRHRSRVQASLSGDTLAAPLRSLGLSLNIDKTPIDAALEALWPGPLLDSDAALRNNGLRADLQMALGSGQLSNISPGYSRILGLFNVASLSRRLRLDFSDLLDKGFAYDRVDARLKVANGRANIDKLLIQGPSANVQVEGDSDLHRGDLDVTLTVMPQLGSSLALASALAGGPAIGAAVLVAERLLKPGIDRAVALRYRVNGSWTEPTLTPLINHPKPPQVGGHNQR